MADEKEVQRTNLLGKEQEEGYTISNPPPGYKTTAKYLYVSDQAQQKREKAVLRKEQIAAGQIASPKAQPSGASSTGTTTAPAPPPGFLGEPSTPGKQGEPGETLDMPTPGEFGDDKEEESTTSFKPADTLPPHVSMGKPLKTMVPTANFVPGGELAPENVKSGVYVDPELEYKLAHLVPQDNVLFSIPGAPGTYQEPKSQDGDGEPIQDDRLREKILPPTFVVPFDSPVNRLGEPLPERAVGWELDGETPFYGGDVAGIWKKYQDDFEEDFPDFQEPTTPMEALALSQRMEAAQRKGVFPGVMALFETWEFLPKFLQSLRAGSIENQIIAQHGAPILWQKKQEKKMDEREAEFNSEEHQSYLDLMSTVFPGAVDRVREFDPRTGKPDDNWLRDVLDRTLRSDKRISNWVISAVKQHIGIISPDDPRGVSAEEVDEAKLLAKEAQRMAYSLSYQDHADIQEYRDVYNALVDEDNPYAGVLAAMHLEQPGSQMLGHMIYDPANIFDIFGQKLAIANQLARQKAFVTPADDIVKALGKNLDSASPAEARVAVTSLIDTIKNRAKQLLGRVADRSLETGVLNRLNASKAHKALTDVKLIVTNLVTNVKNQDTLMDVLVQVAELTSDVDGVALNAWRELGGLLHNPKLALTDASLELSGVLRSLLADADGVLDITKIVDQARKIDQAGGDVLQLAIDLARKSYSELYPTPREIQRGIEAVEAGTKNIDQLNAGIRHFIESGKKFSLVDRIELLKTSEGMLGNLYRFQKGVSGRIFVGMNLGVATRGASTDFLVLAIDGNPSIHLRSYEEWGEIGAKYLGGAEHPAYMQGFSIHEIDEATRAVSEFTNGAYNDLPSFWDALFNKNVEFPLKEGEALDTLTNFTGRVMGNIEQKNSIKITGQAIDHFFRTQLKGLLPSSDELARVGVPQELADNMHQLFLNAYGNTDEAFESFMKVVSGEETVRSVDLFNWIDPNTKDNLRRLGLLDGLEREIVDANSLDEAMNVVDRIFKGQENLARQAEREFPVNPVNQDANAILTNIRESMSIVEGVGISTGQVDEVAGKVVANTNVTDSIGASLQWITNTIATGFDNAINNAAVNMPENVPTLIQMRKKSNQLLQQLDPRTQFRKTVDWARGRTTMAREFGDRLTTAAPDEIAGIIDEAWEALELTSKKPATSSDAKDKIWTTVLDEIPKKYGEARRLAVDEYKQITEGLFDYLGDNVIGRAVKDSPVSKAVGIAERRALELDNAIYVDGVMQPVRGLVRGYVGGRDTKNAIRAMATFVDPNVGTFRHGSTIYDDDILFTINRYGGFDFKSISEIPAEQFPEVFDALHANRVAEKYPMLPDNFKEIFGKGEQVTQEMVTLQSIVDRYKVLEHVDMHDEKYLYDIVSQNLEPEEIMALDDLGKEELHEQLIRISEEQLAENAFIPDAPREVAVRTDVAPPPDGFAGAGRVIPSSDEVVQTFSKGETHVYVVESATEGEHYYKAVDKTGQELHSGVVGEAGLDETVAEASKWIDEFEVPETVAIKQFPDYEMPRSEIIPMLDDATYIDKVTKNNITEARFITPDGRIVMSHAGAGHGDTQAVYWGSYGYTESDTVRLAKETNIVPLMVVQTTEGSHFISYSSPHPPTEHQIEMLREIESVIGEDIWNLSVVDPDDLNNVQRFETLDDLAEIATKGNGFETPGVVPPHDGGFDVSESRDAYEMRDVLGGIRRDLEASLRGVWGQTQGVSMSDEAVEVATKYFDEARPIIEETRLMASKYAQNRRNFALHDYSDRYGVDSILGMFKNFHFWPSRTMVNMAKRVPQNISLVNGYLEYRRMMNKLHADRPEHLRQQWNTNELFGLDMQDPVYLNLEGMLDVYSNIIPGGYSDPDRRATWWSGFLDTLDARIPGNMGMVQQLAIAMGLKGMGEHEAAQSWAGRLIPATRTIKGLTSIVGINDGRGIDLDPYIAAFSQGDIYDYFSGRVLSKHDEKQVAIAMSHLIDKYPDIPEQLIDQAYNHSGPLWDEAIAEVSKRQGTSNLVSMFVGIGARARSQDELKVNAYWKEYIYLQARREEMDSEEYRLERLALMEKYPFAETMMLGRRGTKDRDITYGYSVLSRFPPGSTDDIAEAAGLDYDFVSYFYENKGDITGLPEADQQRIKTFFAEAGATVAIPSGATQRQWIEASARYSAMKDKGREIFGSKIEAQLDAGYNLKGDSMEEMDAWYDYLEKNPKVEEYMAWQTQTILGDAVLAEYYGSIDRLRGYYAGDMYEKLGQEFGEDIWDIQTQYFIYQDSGQKDLAKAWKEDHPQLQEYWDKKNKVYLPEIVAAMVAYGEKLPERPKVELREDIPEEGLSSGAKDIVEAVEAPSVKTYTKKEWLGHLGSEYMNVILAAYNLADLPTSTKELINEKAKEFNLSYNELILSVGEAE